MYFRLEADARECEREEVPAESPANMEEMKLSIGQLEFFDLKQPVILSPK
ncbi:MAG TPA: hypothetical protein VI074_05620 [Propionibacteriaceae bacterium]